jgi:hypothetical protein
MFWEILGIVVTLAVVALAGSGVAFVYGTVYNREEDDDTLEAARLDAYREIMSGVVQLNRTALEVGEKEFHQEADKMLMDKDSELTAPHADVHEAYQRYYYLLEPEVYDAVTTYVDYLVEYHEEGAQVGELLSLGGKVGAAMRDELGLAPIGRVESDGDGDEHEHEDE